MIKPNASFQVYWKINWLRRAVIAAFILSLVLVLLPFVIQFGITHQLNKMGATKSRVEDINLNLFSGTFELKNLQFETNANNAARIELLRADLNMLALASSKVIIDDIMVKGVKAEVLRGDNGELSINGLLLPPHNPTEQPAPLEKDSKPIDFAIVKLNIENAEITYGETDFSQSSVINKITLSNLKSWDMDARTQLDIDLTLNNAPLKVSSKLSLFTEIPQFDGHVSLTRLPVSSYEKFYRDHITRLEAELSIDSKFNIRLSEPPDMKLTGSFSVLDLDADYRHLNQKTQLIHWNGEAQFSGADQISVAGDVDIKQSVTRDTNQQYLVAELGSVKALQLQANLSSIQLEQLQLEGLTFIEKQQDSLDKFVQIHSVIVQKIDQDSQNSKLNISAIAIEEPKVNLVMNAEKQPVHLNPLMKTLDDLKPAAISAQPQQKTAQADAGSKPMAMLIREVSLKKPGVINITDNSVSPVYKSTLYLNKIDIKNLSSTDPAEFQLALKKGDYTEITINGNGLLFNPAELLQLDAKIKQLDLPPVTPYTSNAMGYGMKSGVVDSEIKLTLKEREIDSLIDLKIDSIEVVETHQDTAQQITSASGMSIDLAVSALKDSDNVITLKLPIKGNIDKPDFDLSQIINKAMGKAMQSATLSYLKHTLQPFGSLLTLYDIAKTAANHISLPPILFKANSVEFKEDQQQLINKISTVLRERPALKIKACGVSAAADKLAIEQSLIEIEKEKLEKARLEDSASGKVKPAENKDKTENISIDPKIVQQKLKDLADSRAARVKAFFIDKANLDSSRILNCLSTIRPEKESKPSVEMQI